MTDKEEQKEQDDTDSTLSPRVKKRLENLLQENYVSEENAEAIREFIHELNAVPDKDLKDGRILKYLSQFGQILPEVDFELKEATLSDAERLAIAIDQQDVSASTKRDRRVCLNKFYRTLFKKRNRPTRVWNILDSDVTDTSHPNLSDLERQYDFIFPDEVLEMSEAAMNRRDQLMPLLIYCTGARLNELQNIRIKDLERAETHITVKLNNQKNNNLRPTRKNHLTRCTHIFREWLNQHPRSDDPEAYLFCTLQDSFNPHTGEKVKDKGDKMSKKSISDVLDKLAERIDLDKRHNPHAFRFSMATFFKHKPNWDVDKIADRGGWGSVATVRRYFLDVDEINGNDRLQAQGVEVEGHDMDALDRRTCSNCGNSQPPTQDICECGHALTDAVAREKAENPDILMVERENGVREVRQV